MALRWLGGMVVGGASLALAGCYGNVTLGGNASDGGVNGRDSGSRGEVGEDGGSAGESGRDAGHEATTAKDARGGGSDAVAPSGTVYADAGIYRGDGSFFVDGGAYPDTGSGADGSTSHAGADGSTGIDATPGCAPLAACCSSLSGGSQSLCASVAGSGDATNCAAELTELEGNGDCMGVSVLASEVQVIPTYIVSDGSTLFWTTSSTPGLLAMPAQGGPITTVSSGPIGTSPYFTDFPFLAVDDTNIYVYRHLVITRIPKNGTPPTLVNEPGASLYGGTTLGSTAYWLEWAPPGTCNCRTVALKSAPLLGGAITSVATFSFDNDDATSVGVTSNDLYISPVSVGSASLYERSLGGGAAGSTVGTSSTCTFLASDTDAVYCAEAAGSNLRIASDGTKKTLGTAVSSSYIVFDDAYVYWADEAVAGTIMKAPKAGGGTALVLARDTSPTAIAVDAHSVYWSDAAGYIKSVPK
jgi:hypothetical protein